MQDEGNPKFPIYATIAGVAVVTIPLADYSSLLDAEARLTRFENAKRYPVSPRSPIEVDSEVKAFFMERLGKVDMMGILSECRQRFGAKRTPSRTSAYAFWKRLRDFPSR